MMLISDKAEFETESTKHVKNFITIELMFHNEVITDINYYVPRKVPSK